MKPKRKDFISKYVELTGASEQYADAIWFTLGYRRDSNISGAELADSVVNPRYDYLTD